MWVRVCAGPTCRDVHDGRQVAAGSGLTGAETGGTWTCHSPALRRLRLPRQLRTGPAWRREPTSGPPRPRCRRTTYDVRGCCRCSTMRTPVPLVLVSAPAGSGKTSLVTDWCDACRPRDHDRHRLGHLRAARTRRCGPPWSAAWRGSVSRCPRRRRPADATAVDRELLAAVASAVAAHPRRVTVVIDGYELVSAESAADLDFLLRHSGHRLQLVVLTRADPVLPLYRYRLEGTVTEVRRRRPALHRRRGGPAAADVRHLADPGLRAQPERPHRGLGRRAALRGDASWSTARTPRRPSRRWPATPATSRSTSSGRCSTRRPPRCASCC